MSKKDFSNLNVAPVYDTISEATAETEDTQRKERRTYSRKEAERYLLDRNTQGRKGVKCPRINVAFAPDVYDFIKTMARVRGETLTDFINYLLRESMEEHMDVYEQAVEFRRSL